MHHKKSIISDVVEIIMSFNLLVFSTFSLYNFKTDPGPTKQTAVAYTFTIILLVGVIAYHVYHLIRKEKTTIELDEYPLAHTEPANYSRVTLFIVEVHKPRCGPPEPESVQIGDIRQIENCPNMTLSYR